LAWAKLGIYGGDDSLAGAVDPEALKKSSELMGQDYEIIVVHRGDVGVEFLNRRFGPDVWNGDGNSMSNPARLLSKLWVGPSKLPDVLERFAERCSGYYRMDRNSPVIGEIVTAAHQLLGARVGGILCPWEGKFALESNWPNEDSGWMTGVFEASIPDFDWDRFREWMNLVRYSGNPGLLLQAPLCTAHPDSYPKVKVPCVVGDELLLPDKPAEEQPTSVDALAPKGKEEESSEEAPLSKNSIWKFTSEELLDNDLVFAPLAVEKGRRMVAVAELQVPVVGPEGKRVQAERPVSAPPVVAQATGGSVVKGKCSHKPFLKKDGSKADCVCQWTAPKRKGEESATAYKTRISEWEKLRNTVAKKRGVVLTPK